MESKANFNNPAAGRQGCSIRDNWNQGQEIPRSLTPSLTSPLSKLLYSLSLETGFFHTYIFSHMVPNRCISYTSCYQRETILVLSLISY